MFQESLEERVQELEQALQAERIAAQRDRATITKLQRQINKVSRINVISVSTNRVIIIEHHRRSTCETSCVTNIQRGIYYKRIIDFDFTIEFNLKLNFIFDSLRRMMIR